MRITVRRSGGIAGIALPPDGPLEVDSAELPEGEAPRLRSLVGAHDLDGGRSAQAGRGADRFVYDLTVEGEGRPVRARLPADELPPELRRALDRLILRSVSS